MTKVYLASNQIEIPYQTMKELSQAGKLRLGMSEDIALKLQMAGIKPKGTTSAAFSFYKWLAIIAFFAGMYFAFTSGWWWGIVGFLVMVMIWNGNKAGHRDNLLDAGQNDPQFYERVRLKGGWMYQIDADAAEALRSI
ncbi:hypothetical protein [Pelagibacterium sediminicola]|uniref:hypothetical protein n=1 Tax=Pelagibacterium sediminicola TaxID=2248761 RepID=UPI000E31E62C|nr:hypothetical protein [Pelagibacterium sediminicola]